MSVCVCGGGGGGEMEYGERKKSFCGLSHNWVATEVLGGPGMNVPLPILAMAFWIKVQGGGGEEGARGGGGGNRWLDSHCLLSSLQTQVITYLQINCNAATKGHTKLWQNNGV